VYLCTVPERATLPLGWALYLPEDWCADPVRRRQAKIPEHIQFLTKPQLGLGLVEQAAGYAIDRAPVLGDAAYGENTQLRGDLDSTRIGYVLSMKPETTIFAPGTVFAVPDRRPGSRGPAPAAQRADRAAVAVGEYAKTLAPEDFQTVSFRGKGKSRVSSRFAFKRVTAAHPVARDRQAPREEWLIIEWPEGRETPDDYWISNLPARSKPQRLARLARLRWMIELDYRQLKGELGLDHYEGRSYPGWYHHTALVTTAHAFLTLERTDPKAPRRATLPQAVRLFMPIFDCWTGHCHTCRQPINLAHLPLPD
jgi:SRSO17 transposase